MVKTFQVNIGHRLNQCWPIVNEVLWHITGCKFTGYTKRSIVDMNGKSTNSTYRLHFPGTRELIKGIFRLLGFRRMVHNLLCPWLCACNMAWCWTAISRVDCPFVALRPTDTTVGDSLAVFPVDDFCKLVRLVQTGRRQKAKTYFVFQNQKVVL